MRGFDIVAIILSLAVSAGAHAADKSPASRGIATTIESGGYEEGCVAWSYRVAPKPSVNWRRKILLEFDFANRCGRSVSVILASQNDYGNGAAGYSRAIVLEPGAVHAYGRSSNTGNYIFFNPETDGRLRFWVHQSDRPFRNGVYLDLMRCNLKFPPYRPHPPCPPAVTFDAAGL